MPPLSNDPRVSIVPEAGLALANPLIVTTDDHGFTRVSIRLQNITGHDIAANCIVDWYDASGHPFGGLSAAPQRIAAAPFAPTTCELVAPSAKTSSFGVQIVPTA